MGVPSSSLIELRCAEYAATVAPEAGGRIASLVWSRGGTTCPLLVGWDGHSFEAHHWPKAGAFPMIPFANRLPPEGVVFDGRRIEPEAGHGGFAMHGFAHRRPWDLLLASTRRVVMACVHDGSDPRWPWAWTATQEVRLDAGGVRVEIRVRNDSTERMPLVLGWHPYHPVPSDLLPTDLVFDAGCRHDLDERGGVQDAQSAPAFQMRRGETAAFDGWSGAIRLRNAWGSIEIGCASAGDYLCVEPVTGLPGRLAQAAPLDPGAMRHLGWTCRFEPFGGIA